MPVVLKRVYEKPGAGDGYRVLVDGLWPRGLSKQASRLDEWMREIAPSDELRRWFHSNPSLWSEFRGRYMAELKNHRDALRELAQRAANEQVTLLYGASDTKHNNAVVLKQYLAMLEEG